MIETYAYGVRKYLVSEKEEIKCNNTIKRYKNINFDDAIKEETKKNELNWSEIPDAPCKTLIIGGSECGKINSLFNLINQQPDIDKIYSHAKDPFEAKYQFLIDKWKSTDLKNFNYSKVLKWYG